MNLRLAPKQRSSVRRWSVAKPVLDQLHQVLLGCGFHHTKAQKLPKGIPLRTFDKSLGFYVKQYKTPGGDFEIALSFRGDPHIELPLACVLHYPNKYRGKLIPHLNFGWFLCYVQQMEADWDSNNLLSTYQAVDAQIQSTLDKAVSSVNGGATHADALEGEFAAYWLPAKTLYLLSDPLVEKNLKCEVAVKNRAPDTEEWLAYGDNQRSECQRWIEQRGLTRLGKISFITHFVRVKPSSLAGADWPPESLKALLDWLSDVDTGARSRVLECFAHNPVKRHVFLLDVYQQDVVGLYVQVDLKATSLSTYSSRRQLQRRKKGRPVKLKTLAASLSSTRAVESFIRLGVVKADKPTILSRNRQRPEIGDLSSKRIALVGCGTIGAHVAGLLLRAGAGCGAAHFHLFDDDTLQPTNFGRHPLTTADIGQRKSTALANTLKASTHIAQNIVGKAQNFSITPETLQKYDIILDATGRPPVSKRLAAIARELKGTPPFLIHGFNDGNGRASKVLVDAGTSCYGCMISESSFYKKEVDVRFKDIDHQAERYISCGSSYTPYDAAVSVITAGMMQEAALNCLERQRRWTYSEHMLDGSRSRRPRHIPRQLNCEICNGER